MRMASLIRTRLKDVCTRLELGTFGKETFGYNCTPGWKPPTCAPSGLEPPTYHILGRQHWLVHHGLNKSATKEGSNDMCQSLLSKFVTNITRILKTLTRNTKIKNYCQSRVSVRIVPSIIRVLNKKEQNTMLQDHSQNFKHSFYFSHIMIRSWNWACTMK